MLIKNAVVVQADKLLQDHSVLCRAGKIERVELDSQLQGAEPDEVIDAQGCYLAPGYIDLHIHGTHRFLIDNGPDDLAGLCLLLPQYGVTGFLPTVAPRPKTEDAQFVASLTKLHSEGTQILGFHFEGPFLALTGALPAEAIGEADADRVSALIEAAKPYRAVFSVSPDFDGILELITLMRQNSTPVFMTHTAANVEQAQAAIEAGVRHATHFYDVFPCPAETDPGVRPCGAAEAVLADSGVSLDFIADGEHVDPVAMKLFLVCKGPDRLCLITDANLGAGLAPGRYKLFGQHEVEFAYQGGPARTTKGGPKLGGLCGSGLTLDLAVRNAAKMLEVDIPQAIRMASANPAKVLGIDNVKGHIKEGCDADMVLLDKSLNVLRTWVGGKCCFEKKK